MDCIGIEASDIVSYFEITGSVFAPVVVEGICYCG